MKKYIQQEVMTAKEVFDLLGVSRQTGNYHIRQGNIIPFKREGHNQLFFRTEILDFQRKLEDNRKLYRPYDKK